MKKERIKITLALLVLGMFTVFCANFGGTETAANPITAMLSEFSGRVQVMKATKGVFEAASTDFLLEVNDQVLTGEDGRARIDISDGTIIRLSPLSNFVLTSIEDSGQGTITRLKLNIGRLWIILKGGVVEVDTPSGLASVRGSYLHVWVDPLTGETNITCLEGICTLGNDQGTLSLVAGQTAHIRGKGKAPEAGKMDHQDVNEWLEANPEATLVVVPLTQTVAANQGQPTPVSKTNTPTPTNTIGPSPTTGPTNTPTNTVEAVDCGPPDGWVLHTIRLGETLETLSLLYRVSEEELRIANCRGEMDFVVAGEQFYVPNVATSTPTKTPTPTPLATKTPKPTSGTGSGTDYPTEMSGPVGPDNQIISTTADCGNPYKIKVVDQNGLADVKMIYTFDGSLPMRDTAISAGKYKLLPLISDDVYGVSGYIIDTTGEPTPVGIRFRFVAKDTLGNVTYYPANDAYDLTDKVNCSDNTPAAFSNESGPDGATITDIYACKQTFQVDVVDPDGISWVKLVYSTDGSVPAYGTHSYYLMSNAGGDTYKVVEVVDTTGAGTTVKYVYAVMDSKGNLAHFPATGAFSYSDTIMCGPTSWTTGIGPTGSIDLASNCANSFQIDVSDANGIAEVKVYYTIQDAGLLPDKTSYFAVPLHVGDSIVGTYLLDTAIDINVDGYLAGSTVSWEFRALDTRGIWTMMDSGSFVDNVPCVP
ncbi:MAG: FecR domain-containing protein [Anaerolineales bacterium]|nr:FecR domain-containing protein [Anaerolineales bacterium]